MRICIITLDRASDVGSNLNFPGPWGEGVIQPGCVFRSNSDSFIRELHPRTPEQLGSLLGAGEPLPTIEDQTHFNSYVAIAGSHLKLISLKNF